MSLPDHAVERQRNAISFAIFLLKTLVLLSSASVVALLALLGSEFTQNHGYVIDVVKDVMPYFVLSLFYSICASYMAYWSEIYAYEWEIKTYELSIKHYNSHEEKNVVNRKNYIRERAVILFNAAHVYTLLAAFVFFIAALRFVWLM